VPRTGPRCRQADRVPRWRTRLAVVV